MTRQWERERERRGQPRADGSGMRARMRPGYRLSIIDLSGTGALVEAARPLRPGTHVDLQFESDERHGQVSARVVRCAVASINAEAITYRAALSFIDTCDWVREVLTPDGYGIPGSGPGAIRREPAPGDQLPVSGDGQQDALTTRLK